MHDFTSRNASYWRYLSVCLSVCHCVTYLTYVSFTFTTSSARRIHNKVIL